MEEWRPDARIAAAQVKGEEEVGKKMSDFVDGHLKEDFIHRIVLERIISYQFYIRPLEKADRKSVV